MVSRMSGGDSCAIVEPSVNSTIEWTIDCGCTTTSIRSYGMPNSRCASITSRPLLTSVALLVVISVPMSQVGWASACSGRDVAQVVAGASAERSAAGGDDELAHLVRAAAAQALGERRVLGVDRAQLARLGARRDQRAAGDEGFLVRERDRASRVEGGEGGAQTLRACDGVEDDVRVRRGERDRLVRPDGGTDAELGRLLGEQVRVRAAGGEPDDLEAVGGVADDVERLRADRPGRAEHDHPAAFSHAAPVCPPRGLPAGDRSGGGSEHQRGDPGDGSPRG